jgi:hypothetical protein
MSHKFLFVYLVILLFGCSLPNNIPPNSQQSGSEDTIKITIKDTSGFVNTREIGIVGPYRMGSNGWKLISKDSFDIEWWITKDTVFVIHEDKIDSMAAVYFSAKVGGYLTHDTTIFR